MADSFLSSRKAEPSSQHRGPIARVAFRSDPCREDGDKSDRGRRHCYVAFTVWATRAEMGHSFINVSGR